MVSTPQKTNGSKPLTGYCRAGAAAAASTAAACSASCNASAAAGSAWSVSSAAWTRCWMILTISGSMPAGHQHTCSTAPMRGQMTATQGIQPAAGDTRTHTYGVRYAAGDAWVLLPSCGHQRRDVVLYVAPSAEEVGRDNDAAGTRFHAAPCRCTAGSSRHVVMRVRSHDPLPHAHVKRMLATLCGQLLAPLTPSSRPQKCVVEAAPPPQEGPCICTSPMACAMLGSAISMWAGSTMRCCVICWYS